MRRTGSGPGGADGTTQRLAEWAAGLTYNSLPDTAIARAKRAVADFAAEALFVATATPWGRTIAEFAAHGLPRAATLVSRVSATSPACAALGNGTFALGFEYADALPRTSLRGYAMAVPPAMALAEARGSSGRDMLTAIVAGYEVMDRIAYALDIEVRQAIYSRGFYFPAVVGGFGAAAAASRVIGLPSEGMTAALGIAGSYSSALFQGHEEGAWTRSLNGGMSCQRAVLAAELAETGFMAPVGILEGSAGFYAAYADGQYDPAALCDVPGGKLAIERSWIKARPINATLQAPVEALLAIRSAHSLTPDDIVRVTASWHKYVPFLGKTEVQTVVSAQASLPFVLALGCVRGHVGVDDFTVESVQDPEVRRMLDKIEVQADPQLYELVRHESLPGRVTVETRDGRKLTEEVLFPKGHWRNPMSDAEFAAKFMDLTERVLPLDRCERLLSTVMDLDADSGLEAMTRELRACGAAAAKDGSASTEGGAAHE